MSSGPDRQPRRGRYLSLLGLILALVLVVSFATNWLLYQSVRDQLDEQMGERLLAIGTTVARTIGWDGVLELSIGSESSAEYSLVARELDEIARQNDLAALFLIDSDYRFLVGEGKSLSLGEVDPVLELQAELPRLFVEGEPLTTALEPVDVPGLPPQYLKTGFAPVMDPDGIVVGAVIAEGGRDFFSVLPRLRSRLLFSALLGLLATSALGGIFFFTLRSLIRLEDSLKSTAALAAIGQISSVVAHEIKNPLAIIRSRSERVRSKIVAGKDAEEILEWFDVIPSEVDRLNEIVTNYLSLARPEAQGEGRCRLRAVVEETVQLLSHDLEKKGIQLRSELEGDWEIGIGSRSLKQILLNLILNAAQAIDEQGEVVVDGELKSKKWAVLSIRDTGRGMTDEERRRVAEPFFTTKPTGSGLGLTLVHSLVRARQGKVEIKSQPGAGTEVRIFLPTVEPNRTDPPKES